MLISDLFILPYQRRKEQIIHSFRSKKSLNEEFAIQKLKEYRYANISVHDYILGLKYDLENYYKEKVETLTDFERVISR